MESARDEHGDVMTHRDSRGWRLAAVVTVQSVLVAACLALTIHMYSVQQRESQDGPIYIEFDTISDILYNETLKFSDFESNNVDLANNSKICIKCNGPYLLHMEVCCIGLDDKEGNGILELQVVGKVTPLSNFALQGKDVVCRELHTTVYLRREQEAFLYFSSPDRLKIKNVSLGLNYLRGERCLY